MKIDKNLLRKIYEKTDGRCHLCHKPIAFTNYGHLEGRGAWEIDHSRPRARGGCDRVGNLLPAHIDCNRAKGAGYNRTQRSQYGHTQAPLSREEERQREIFIQVIMVSGIFLVIWLLTKIFKPQNSQPQPMGPKILQPGRSGGFYGS